jgi:hypothetical protein
LLPWYPFQTLHRMKLEQCAEKVPAETRVNGEGSATKTFNFTNSHYFGRQLLSAHRQTHFKRYRQSIQGDLGPTVGLCTGPYGSPRGVGSFLWAPLCRCWQVSPGRTPSSSEGREPWDSRSHDLADRCTGNVAGIRYRCRQVSPGIKRII